MSATPDSSSPSATCSSASPSSAGGGQADPGQRRPGPPRCQEQAVSVPAAGHHPGPRVPGLIRPGPADRRRASRLRDRRRTGLPATVVNIPMPESSRGDHGRECVVTTRSPRGAGTSTRCSSQRSRDPQAGWSRNSHQSPRANGSAGIAWSIIRSRKSSRDRSESSPDSTRNRSRSR